LSLGSASANFCVAKAKRGLQEAEQLSLGSASANFCVAKAKRGLQEAEQKLSMRLNKTEGRLSRSLVRLRRTEGGPVGAHQLGCYATQGFVKPELAATLPVNGLTGSVAASSGYVPAICEAIALLARVASKQSTRSAARCAKG